MKCPECGKELSKDEVLIPIHDKDTGEIIGWQHCNYEVHKRFLDACEIMGKTPSELMETYMVAFIKAVKRIGK